MTNPILEVHAFRQRYLPLGSRRFPVARTIQLKSLPMQVMAEQSATALRVAALQLTDQRLVALSLRPRLETLDLLTTELLNALAREGEKKPDLILAPEIDRSSVGSRRLKPLDELKGEMAEIGAAFPHTAFGFGFALLGPAIKGRRTLTNHFGLFYGNTAHILEKEDPHRRLLRLNGTKMAVFICSEAGNESMLGPYQANLESADPTPILHPSNVFFERGWHLHHKLFRTLAGRHPIVSLNIAGPNSLGHSKFCLQPTAPANQPLGFALDESEQVVVVDV